MKKDNLLTAPEADTDAEMLEEYDFSGGKRGFYAERYAQGTNLVALSPDVAALFPNSEAVNDALRTLIRSAHHRAKPKPRRKRQAALQISSRRRTPRRHRSRLASTARRVAPLVHLHQPLWQFIHAEMERDMNVAVYSSAAALVTRAKAVRRKGFCETAAEWQSLNADLGGVIPEWYITLMTSVPLAGLNLGWKPSGRDDNHEDVNWIEWFETSNIRLEALELHPGRSLLGRGYFCVAGDNGTGNQYFISMHEGEDPPLYQIDHETDEDAGEILTAGRETIALSLSEFFKAAQVKAEAVY